MCYTYSFFVQLADKQWTIIFSARHPLGAIDALNLQVAGKVGLVSAFRTSQNFSELKILHFRFNIGIASAFFIQFCWLSLWMFNYFASCRTYVTTSWKEDMTCNIVNYNERDPKYKSKYLWCRCFIKKQLMWEVEQLYIIY